jgi:hypothetical protein
MHAAITVTHNAGPWTYVLRTYTEAANTAARLRSLGYPVTDPEWTDQPVTGMARHMVTTIYA